jgi:hypothetical protein
MKVYDLIIKDQVTNVYDFTCILKDNCRLVSTIFKLMLKFLIFIICFY